MNRTGLETIGMNRCTTCIHYKHERYGCDQLVGCMERNEFKLNTPWNLNETEGPCSSYVIDLTVVEKVLPYVEGRIDASRELLAQLEHRREVLSAALAEYEAAKPVSADGFEKT